MKKLLVLSVILAMQQAQARSIEQGTIEFKGNSGGLYSYNTATEKDGFNVYNIYTSQIKFDAAFAYYVANNFALGTEIYFSNSTSEVSGSQNYTFTDANVIVGPYVAFIAPMTEKLNVRVGALAGYVATEYGEHGYGRINKNRSGWGVQAGVELNYFVSNDAAINAGIDYASVTTITRLSHGPALSVGFSIYLK